MALTMQYADPFGVEPLDAYIAATEFYFNGLTKTLTFTLGVWTSAGAALAGKPQVGQFSYTVNATAGDVFPSFDDVVAQNSDAYEAVKAAIYTLAKSAPELATATDFVPPQQ